MTEPAGGAAVNPFEGVVKMCELLDKYTAAMNAGDPAAARDIAFEMLGVMNGLYNTAYSAAARQARRQGRIG